MKFSFDDEAFRRVFYNEDRAPIGREK